MLLKIISAIFLSFLLGGCAGQLQIFDSDGKSSPGVPFHTAEVYVKKGQHNKHSEKGDNCEPADFVTTVSIATGPLYYAQVKTAQLAKTAFHIKYGDNGAVSEIGLDSEPSGAETLRATGELLGTILPFAGLSAVASKNLQSMENVSRPACDAGEVAVKFIPLSQYSKAQ